MGLLKSLLARTRSRSGITAFTSLLSGLECGYFHLLSDDSINEFVEPIHVFLYCFQALLDFVTLGFIVGLEHVNIADDVR